MVERSRIRFNPVTGEIEVEGPEAFVKTYFRKLQQQLADGGPSGARPVGKAARRAAIAAKSKAGGVKNKGRKGTFSDRVVTLIRQSQEGMTTATLKAKTGLTEKQIWGIIYQAEKQGKIKKTKRGLYLAA